MSAQRNFGWVMLAAFVALMLWLLGKGSTVLHGASSVHFYQPDPNTGAPQFNSNDAASVPAGQGLAALHDPVSGALIQPPSGYVLWRDEANGSYWYYPYAVTGVGANVQPVSSDSGITGNGIY